MLRSRLYCYNDIVALHILPILRHPPNLKSFLKTEPAVAGYIPIAD